MRLNTGYVILLRNMTVSEGSMKPKLTLDAIIKEAGVFAEIERAFPNWCKWGKLLLDEASSLVKEIS